MNYFIELIKRVVIEWENERQFNRNMRQLEHDRDIDIEHESNTCKSCEALKDQVNQLIRDKEYLQEQIFKKPELVQVNDVVREPYKPSRIPWQVKRQQLQEQSRKQADIIRNEKERELSNITTTFPVQADQVNKEKVEIEIPSDATDLERDVLSAKVN